MDMERVLAAEASVPRRALSEQDKVEALAEIEKGQQLAGHFPNTEALDRARRILDGETTPDEARAELLAKYADG